MKALNHTSKLFNEKYYLTNGGLETTLIFHRGITLNYFAAFDLLRSENGKKELEQYFRSYLLLAERHKLGFVIESPTWRASADWGFRLGYSHDELFTLNKNSIKFVRRLAGSYDRLPQVIVSGNVGPRGDGYKAELRMTSGQAKAYHIDQIKAFAMADADLVTAVTITYSDEAIGIVNAARLFGIPVVISFTVETDGKLPSGESLQDAIKRTDSETDYYAEHYMMNCAHPHHFIGEFQDDGDWKWRIGGIRANASLKSHADLDESDTLDAGDKCLLAQGYSDLFWLLPNIKVIGGCCGTDHSHLEEICEELFG
jgi:S-methylmethionine-dependent homocysteine/selenocysteine methylase